MSKNLTLGIIGSGQLGSLLCQSAKNLKIKTVVISDDKDGPAQKHADYFIFTDYNNKEKVKEFIDKVDVVTFEFENIPIEILESIDKVKLVIPKPKINEIIQNRKLEKTFLNNLGIKTTEWAFINSAEDIKKNKNLLPGILKTNTLGYDGHGQFVINELGDINDIPNFDNQFILEKKVNLSKEISVVLSRFANKQTYTYEPIENIHKDQILKYSKIPANVTEELFKKSQNIAKLIAKKLDYVGTMCVEYFIDKNEILLVNEIAPRVHNSGHLTINAFNISQFENHIRAVCSLKSEKIKKISNAEMTNILGNEIKNCKRIMHRITIK